MENQPLTIAVICDLILRVKTAQIALYQAAPTLLPEQKRLWQILQNDCEGHAIIYGKVKNAATDNPGRWTTQHFTVQVPSLLLKEMAVKTAELPGGKLNKRFMATFMADTEKSLIDAKCYDAIRTDIMEFTNQLDSIKNESLAHISKLRELIPLLS